MCVRNYMFCCKVSHFVLRVAPREPVIAAFSQKTLELLKTYCNKKLLMEMTKKIPPKNILNARKLVIRSY